MNKRLKDEGLDELFDAILTLEDKEECYSFFRDLCTVPELKTLSQRFHVAKMLVEKRVYSDIVEETGASTATISRVNRSLSEDYDSCGGYALVFKRLEDKE
ncbi:MAG: TrpR-like protein, YerC/YecD [Oscillospiraceae bacterium]|nr:TrpR-like protein, YerC/YecD [Oscillospiraceae bacterium]